MVDDAPCPEIGEDQGPVDLNQDTSRRMKARPSIRRDAGHCLYTPSMKSRCAGLTVPSNNQLAANRGKHAREEANIAFDESCPFASWPEVPTTVLAARDDRLSPIDFQRRVARERLGLGVLEMPDGHLKALSRPEAVAVAMLGIEVGATAARP